MLSATEVEQLVHELRHAPATSMTGNYVSLPVPRAVAIALALEEYRDSLKGSENTTTS